MNQLPGRPRLLAVGEPTHGIDALLDVRNELFRQLVERDGYRFIALESNCLMGTVVDDYVTSGTGSLDDVMDRGFSHGWGALAGNRQLVQWMRDHNEGRPRSESVRFAGVDGPLEMSAAASPRIALAYLHDFLARWGDDALLPASSETIHRLVGDDGSWTDPKAMMEPSHSIGRSAESIQLRCIADDLVELLAMQAPQLAAATSHDDLERARMFGRTATGLLRYHFWMADDSSERMARLCGLRDSMMASNLIALAEQGPTLAYAHNSHLQCELSTMQLGSGRISWWSAGALVHNRIGDEYAFVPTALGTVRNHDVDVPPLDTVEGILYEFPDPRIVVDTRALVDALGDSRPAARVSPWFGYAPIDPTHLGTYPALLFVKNADS